jgi:ABC-type Mn2+/Zn2+ transport system permease subunit
MSWLDSYQHRAVVEVVLVGALAGLVGVQVVLRRLAFFTMALTHATFPGVVIAAILGVNLYVGGAAGGLVVAGAVFASSRRRGQDWSTATGVILAAGFALGIALISSQSGLTRDLSVYLVGSILTVDRSDLATAAAITVVVGVLLSLIRKETLFSAFDADGARAAGLPVPMLDLIVLLVVQAAVVSSVPAVGTILSVALIVAPAAAARLWTDNVRVMIATAVGIAVGAGLAGLALSVRYAVAAGGAITLIAAAAFGASWLVAPNGVVVRAGLLSRLSDGVRSVGMFRTRRPCG